MRKLLIGLAALAIAARLRPRCPRRQGARFHHQRRSRRQTVQAPSRATQLRKGPVVLYFFPKAFTSGCTAEAHAFSDAIGDFKKAGAQVIGMSADDLPTLKKFSVEDCRSAFPVATATPATQKAYDVAWAAHPGLTTRTSYVIDRNGRIAMVHDDLDFSQHVAKTLAAVRSLKH